MPLFAAITRFAQTLSEPGIDSQSEPFQASQLREALDAAMPALLQSGIAPRLRSTRTQRGTELIQSILEDIDMLLV
jgi:hypothetical protein